MTAPDALAVRCRYCRASRGQPCRTGSFTNCPPHKIRRADALSAAAHADPALDEWFVQSGPCGLCGAPGLDGGVLGARHRVIDAIAGALAAGESPEVAAWDYNLPAGAITAVQQWMGKWPGGWRG